MKCNVGDSTRTCLDIGLVPDSKYNDLREPFLPIAFFPDAQTERAGSNSKVLVRSRLLFAAVTASMTKAVSNMNPAAIVYTQTFQSVIQRSLTRERLMATLSGFFGLLAGLQAVIGLYGVMSYTVTRRTYEIGIRMALGTDHRAVMRMILTEAVVLLGMGILVGSTVAFASNGAIRALLYGPQPNDPLTFALCAVGLGSVALVAAAVPARCAARNDPAVGWLSATT